MKLLLAVPVTALLTLTVAATSTAPAAAGSVDPGNPGSTVHWYASKADIRTSPVPTKVCFSGTLWDRAGDNSDFKVTGKIWEPSLGRRIHLQRRAGKTWKTVKSVWSDGPLVSPNYVLCINRRKGN